jgi:UDP-4-amino-4-deoxy-L-arabinose-oxoglutarate aminotransferase
VVEDAAHAVGTYYKGEHVGSKGTSIFSFHPIKNMTTGEGGMVTSDDAAFLDQIRQLRFHGLGVDAFDRTTQGRTPQAEVLQPGYKCNMPDLCAALGLSQLARIEEMNARRVEIANRYIERLAEIPLVLPLIPPAHDHVHAWHLFVVRLDTDAANMTRETFMEELKKLGIGTGIHFRAVHLQKYYLENGCSRGTLPDTEWNSDRICSIPLYPDMTDQDVDRVVDAIATVLAPVSV